MGQLAQIDIMKANNMNMPKEDKEFQQEVFEAN
jgi:hypothetical protein